MTPRFVNPHFLPDTTTLISRKQIYAEDSTDAKDDEHTLPMDDSLIEELHKLIHASLDSEIHSEAHRKKRRKLEPTHGVSGPEPVLFRLISNSQSLHPLLLEPKPPPPPITREPECEDNATQAKMRKKQAIAAAVDISWISKESQKSATPSHNTRLKHFVTKTTLPIPAPNLMLIEIDQEHRKTRPPAPSSYLLHPYVENGPIPSQEAITTNPECTVFTAKVLKPYISTNGVKRRRKRGKISNQHRPPASFWRPNPAHGGKSLGYAMGYPCSLAALENHPSSLHRIKPHYLRDTMQKGVHVDFLDQ